MISRKCPPKSAGQGHARQTEWPSGNVRRRRVARKEKGQQDKGTMEQKLLD